MIRWEIFSLARLLRSARPALRSIHFRFSFVRLGIQASLSGASTGSLTLSVGCRKTCGGNEEIEGGLSQKWAKDWRDQRQRQPGRLPLSTEDPTLVLRIVALECPNRPRRRRECAVPFWQGGRPKVFPVSPARRRSPQCLPSACRLPSGLPHASGRRQPYPP